MSDEHDPVVTESVLKSELTILRSELKSELSGFRSQLTDLLEKRISEESATTRAYVEQRIAEEGATTRAHFDIMVEKMDGTVKLVAEVAAHHGIVLDDHESRLQKIEKR